jgi:hypothetical protein
MSWLSQLLRGARVTVQTPIGPVVVGDGGESLRSALAAHAAKIDTAGRMAATRVLVEKANLPISQAINLANAIMDAVMDAASR